jgi:hypothetical protein
VLLGVAPQLVVSTLINPLLPALGVAPLSGVGWLGIAAGQGSWLATGGLVLGIAALVVGALIYWLPVRVGGAAAAGGPPTVFTGGEPLRVEGRLGASDFTHMVKSALGPFYRGFDVDRFYLWAWRALCRLADRVSDVLGAAEKVPVAALVAGAAAVGLAGLLLPAAAAAHGAASAHVSLAPLAAAVAVAGAGLLLACGASAARRLALPLGLAVALATGALLAPAGMARVVLLELATLLALLALWWSSDSERARWGYLTAVVLSGLAMFAGALAAERGHVTAALALLLPGVAVKLALVPVWFWLPLVAGSTPAVVTGLVVGIVDVAAFGEVLTLRGHAPWLFEGQSAWLALGVASTLGGALLALAQRDVRRLLAFSTIMDMGLLVIALALGGTIGVSGALIGAAVHALAKALLFASVAGPEAAGEALVDARGLATRHPVAMFGFVVGSLAVLGVPPTLGFAAHWRILGAAAGNTPLFAALCGAAMLAVATYARAIAIFWWGEARPAPATRGGASVPLLSAAVVLLAVALLAAGLWPALLGGEA